MTGHHDLKIRDKILLKLKKINSPTNEISVHVRGQNVLLGGFIDNNLNNKVVEEAALSISDKFIIENNILSKNNL